MIDHTCMYDLSLWLSIYRLDVDEVLVEDLVLLTWGQHKGVLLLRRHQLRVDLAVCQLVGQVLILNQRQLLLLRVVE